MNEQPKQPTPELLPCPFCGDNNGRPFVHSIVCDSCECFGPFVDIGETDTDGSIRQRVIDKWNNRTTRTLTPKQVELARWLLDNVDVDVYEEISWIRISYKLLREVVGE